MDNPSTRIERGVRVCRQARTVAVVDDDEDARKGLARLLRALGRRALLFASAEEFEAQAVDIDDFILLAAIADAMSAQAGVYELRG